MTDTVVMKYKGGPRAGKVEEFDSLRRVVTCHEEAKENGMCGIYRLHMQLIAKPENCPVLQWHEVDK